jgi:tetratricopeptide (TPR) repeat protein
MFGPPFTLTKVIFLSLLAIALWVYFAWQLRHRWQDRRRRREFAAEGGLRSQKRPRGRQIAAGLFTVAIFACAAVMVFFSRFGSPDARARLHAIELGVTAAMKWLGAVLIILLAFLLLLYSLNRDNAASAAAKLALAGKRREAEELIRGAIQAKGPTEQRLTVLGTLLLEQGRLDEALEQMEAARRLAKHPATALNNCATVLWKLGRRDESRQLLDEACSLEPQNLTALCNSCLLLAEMSLEVQAFDRLEQAEQIYERYDPSQVKHWKPLLEQCRKALPRAKGFPVTHVEKASLPNLPSNT